MGFRLAVYRLAWPSYDCEQCVGQDEWAGCYCAFYGASSPGHGPTRSETAARFLYNWAWRNKISDGRPY